MVVTRLLATASFMSQLIMSENVNPNINFNIFIIFFYVTNYCLPLCACNAVLAFLYLKTCSSFIQS